VVTVPSVELIGMALAEFDAALEPTAFVPTTVQVYSVPFVSPVKVTPGPVKLTVFVCEELTHVANPAVTSEPPSLGTENERVI